MSARGYDGHHYRGRGLYRDSENGVLMGVCAGFANLFNLRVNAVRIVTVILALIMFWPTVGVYLLAGFLLRNRPLYYCGPGDERHFWRRGGSRRHDYYR